MSEEPLPAPGEKYHTPPKEVYAAWLDLRGMAPLAAVAEMLRQDLDGDLLTTVREDGQRLLSEGRGAHGPGEGPRQGRAGAHTLRGPPAGVTEIRAMGAYRSPEARR